MRQMGLYFLPILFLSKFSPGISKNFLAPGVSNLLDMTSPFSQATGVESARACQGHPSQEVIEAKQTRLESCAQPRNVLKWSVPKAKTRLRILEGDLVQEGWQQDYTRGCLAGSREKLPCAHLTDLACNGPPRISGT